MCATVRFFPCVNEGVSLQMVFSAERLVALRTTVFDPIVRLLVTEKAVPRRKCLGTFVTILYFPSVNEGVGLQSAFLSEGLVALWAIVFHPTMGLPVKEKASPTCKCLRTFVTR